MVARKECGCIPGEYMCAIHRRQLEARASRRLTPEQRAYDDYVDPLHAYHSRFPSGCTCHISAPCSHCVSQSESEPEETS